MKIGEVLRDANKLTQKEISLLIIGLVFSVREV